MMKDLVAAFPAQLREAVEIGRSYQFKQDVPAGIQNVLLTGLGGSGIGGSIVQNYVADKLRVPFLVNKDYRLPAFVGKGTLLIVSSYSGNTEETAAAMHAALQSGAHVVCVTSGGKVAEEAARHGLDCIVLPGGMPPRSCLGYSTVQVLFTLRHAGLLDAGDDDWESQIAAAAALIEGAQEQIKSEAAGIAKQLAKSMPIIYADAGMEGVAIRFRQQLNENGKMLCWHHAIPEMNHNELVGWRDEDDSRVVVMLRTAQDHPRSEMRMEINKGIIQKWTPNILELRAQGEGWWQQAIWLIHLTDWISVYCADERGMDATEVNVIDFLKGELAKQ